MSIFLMIWSTALLSGWLHAWIKRDTCLVSWIYYRYTRTDTHISKLVLSHGSPARKVVSALVGPDNRWVSGEQLLLVDQGFLRE